MKSLYQIQRINDLFGLLLSNHTKATYPQIVILAGSEEEDTILDPFMGAGTTAAVAKSLNRYYIGCELNEDYGNLIQKRIQDYQPVKEVAQEPTVNILDII